MPDDQNQPDDAPAGGGTKSHGRPRRYKPEASKNSNLITIVGLVVVILAIVGTYFWGQRDVKRPVPAETSPTTQPAAPVPGVTETPKDAAQ